MFIKCDCGVQDGFPALHIACGVNYNDEVIDVLLAAKADVNLADNETGATALHFAAEFNAGVKVINKLLGAGADIIAIGEMGIGNTASAALLMHRLAPAPLNDCIGVGAGQDEAGMAKKRAALERAAARSGASAPFDVLREFGGLEIVMMTGAIFGAAERRRPVMIDGFIASAAALVAIRMTPAAQDYCIFAHRSAERGHTLMLASLKATPLLELGMRLGEGTGAVLAIPIVRAAARLFTDVAALEDVLTGKI